MKGGEKEMSKRICVRNCDFMTIDDYKITCDLYDSQLKLEKFNPEHFTFTILKCKECLEAEVTQKESGGEDKLQQLDSEISLLSDYFYSVVSDFEESLTSISAIIKTLRKDKK